MPMRVRGLHRIGFFESSSGSMTVEFVAFAPLLIAVLFISFEFAKAFWAYDVIARDLHAAVRYLSRAPSYSATTRTQAENVAKTGSPDGTTMHFPWTNTTCIDAQGENRPAFSYTDETITGLYSDSVLKLTMTANVPLTLSLLEGLNQLLERMRGAVGQPADSALPVGYCLTVSYQTRYVGN
jgi:Flp pilus assembly protein TadG